MIYVLVEAGEGKTGTIIIGSSKDDLIAKAAQEFQEYPDYWDELSQIALIKMLKDYSNWTPGEHELTEVEPIWKRWTLRIEESDIEKSKNLTGDAMKEYLRSQAVCICDATPEEEAERKACRDESKVKHWCCPDCGMQFKRTLEWTSDTSHKCPGTEGMTVVPPPIDNHWYCPVCGLGIEQSSFNKINTEHECPGPIENMYKAIEKFKAVNVQAIVREHLERNGYDGLCKKCQEELDQRRGLCEDEDQCSCGIDDLICCIDSGPEACLPGHKVPLMPKMDSVDGRGNKLDWYITTRKD